LILSVYTGREGKATDAEHNTLMELSGDPTKAAWTPKKEVFPDTEHIARASHLTLIQLSELSLVNVIEGAGARLLPLPRMRAGVRAACLRMQLPQRTSHLDL